MGVCVCMCNIFRAGNKTQIVIRNSMVSCESF